MIYGKAPRLLVDASKYPTCTANLLENHEHYYPGSPLVILVNLDGMSFIAIKLESGKVLPKNTFPLVSDSIFDGTHRAMATTYMGIPFTVELLKQTTTNTEDTSS